MFRKFKKGSKLAKLKEDSGLDTSVTSSQLRVATTKDENSTVVEENILPTIAEYDSNAPGNRGSSLVGSGHAPSRLDKSNVAKNCSVPTVTKTSEAKGAHRSESTSSDISELVERAKLTEGSLGFSTDIMADKKDVSSGSESEEETSSEAEVIQESSSPAKQEKAETTKANSEQVKEKEDKAKESRDNAKEEDEKLKEKEAALDECESHEEAIVEPKDEAKAKATDAHVEEKIIAGVKEEAPKEEESSSPAIERKHSNTPTPQPAVVSVKAPQRESY